VLSRAFNWTQDALIAGVPANEAVPALVRFKAARAREPGDSPLVNLAYNLSVIVRTNATLEPYRGVPADPAQLRAEASDHDGQVTLNSLLTWMWDAGIPVVPFPGHGGFSAAVWLVDAVPVVVLKEAREFAAFWLFDLAHELGHIARGHLMHGGFVEVGPPQVQSDTDQDEQEASDFALQLLIPTYRTLLREVQIQARGSHLLFKGAVEAVSRRANVNVGLLGMVAAHDLTEVGQPKDRWGSATNLARPDGPGRSLAEVTAWQHLATSPLSDIDRMLVKALLGPPES
jgi:hypothetical protein